MKITGVNDNFVKTTLENAKTSHVEKNFESTLKKAFDEQDDKELKKVCSDFENIMLNIMYKQMKATVSKSKLIPQESGREMFQSMLDDELVKNSSKKSELGLGDLLYNQMKKQMANMYTKK